MTPADLRAALAAACDLVDGVWVEHGHADLAYADGGEAHVAATITRAGDIATGSPELARGIHDWASQYHLAAARANLLRPVALAANLAVLEIGAGCGATTRYLGERCGTVLALEGSLARARIAASRCRDLDNVVVACGRFPGFALAGAFDLVTLVGVLEYSRVYVQGTDPVQAVLEAAKARLASGGRLMVAIENQLGVKYLAGSPEDHLGIPFAGVTGEYGAKSPVTFGRGELRERLAGAGFASVEFLYPFPDYKLPSAILTEAAFDHRGFNASDLVATTSHGHRFGEPEARAYAESLARDVFVRNGMGPETANSFLAIAGERPSAPKDALAWVYSVGRDRPYACETRFVAEPSGIAVERRPLYDAAHPALAQMREGRSRYIEGEVLHRGLERLLAHPGWTVAMLAEWAAPWIEFLERQAPGGGARSPDLELPAPLFDCLPFNVVRRDDGTLVAFDLEWRAPGTERVTLAHVAFRGIYHGLLRVPHVAPPARGVTTDIASLASAAIAELGIATPIVKVHEWIGADFQMTGVIAGTPRATAMPFLPRLPVPEPPPPPPTPSEEVQALAVRLSANEELLAQAVHRQRELAGRSRELVSTLARPHHRLATWFGNLIEPYPRLRAAVRAPFDARRGGRRVRIGAIVHVHYDELWPELASALRNAGALDEIYISIRADAPTTLEVAITADFPLAKVRRVVNRGRDVWPFLEALAMARRDAVEIVCKVHGKRSPHVPTGEAWRHDIIDKLLGSGATVREILDAFRNDPTLGILGPGGHVVPSTYHWERNAATVTQLAARMGVDVTGLEFRYVAGSMFWARVEALAPILELRLGEGDFSAEPAPVDGALAHALERCFPLAALKAGFTVRESANAAGTTVRDFAP